VFPRPKGNFGKRKERQRRSRKRNQTELKEGHKRNVIIKQPFCLAPETKTKRRKDRGRNIRECQLDSLGDSEGS